MMMLKEEFLMPHRKLSITSHLTIYLSAWVTYILFTLMTFSFFDISVMLFSIALSVLGAWIYGYAGCLSTTLLTIPYHYLMLTFSSSIPDQWIEAFNPVGISTQLFISLTAAMIKSAKDKLNHLNTELDLRVSARTIDLNRLREHIIGNQETAEFLLNKTLLEDIKTSLSDMLKESNHIKIDLLNKGVPEAAQCMRFCELTEETITLTNNLQLNEFFHIHNKTDFSALTYALMDTLKETAGTCFELNIESGYTMIPEPVQYQLFRITNEAITNAIRHAKADLIQISLVLNDTAYHLTVTNNGGGMPDHPEKGLGLEFMKNRALQIGGTIHFDTTQEGLTRLQCIAPKSLHAPE
jgi:glucose-6-phosphate-specific signal transduction histidine kinase